MKPNLREITSKPGMGMVDDYIDFRNIIYSFWENRKIIFITMLASIVLAGTYLFFKTPQYEGNVLLSVQDKTNQGLSNLSQKMGLNGAEISLAAKHTALIKTKFILEPVIDRLGLNLTITQKSLPIIGKFFSDPDASIKLKHIDVAPIYLEKSLHLLALDQQHYQLFDDHKVLLVTGEVGKDIKGNGININVEKLNIKKKMSFNIVKHSKSLTINRLATQLNIAELGEVGGKETGILQIAMKHTDPTYLINVLNEVAHISALKDAERKSLETSKTLEFLKLQLPIVKKDLVQAETKYNIYRAKSGKMDIKFETTHLLNLIDYMEKQITLVSLNLAELQQRYTNKHPFIISLHDKIKQLEKQKAILEVRVRSLPASDQTMIALMRDVKVKNNLYLILLNKIQELKVMEAGTISDVRILSLADIPDAPLSKKIPIVMSAATILGFVLGCIIVIALRAFLRRVTDPHWIEKHLHINNLAIIPYSKQQAINLSEFKSKKCSHIEILANQYPKDLSIESLRSLRTSFQILASGAHNNIISIMGVTQGIGKSFVSVNFAYLLANTDKRVLLIDGDIRKGHLHDYFRVKQVGGLSEVLNGNTTIDQAIHKTPNANLDFISCGLYPHNPSELLLQSHFKNLIEMLSQQYDYIIIDTAPILAVTDSTIIGAIASMNLLVIGADIHQPEEIMQAVKSIDSAGIKLMGSIFNSLKPEASMNGSYRYNYYSKYESDEPMTKAV